MTPAYSKLYLGDASLALGSMLESAVYLFGIDLEIFWKLFLTSYVSAEFACGLSGTVSGKSGWELAVSVLEDANVEFTHEKPKGVVGRSREFWAGWGLAQYQWRTGLSFAEIEAFAPLKMILLMYSPYHEMDVVRLFEVLDGKRKDAEV